MDLLVNKNQLNEELEKIENVEIRKFTRKMLDNVPYYFWDPKFKASSSGKYHLEVNGEVESLIDHTKRVFRVSRIFIENPLFGGLLLTGDDNDCLMSACLLHDSVKRGFDETDLQHTKFEHPLYVTELANKVLTPEERIKPFVNKVLRLVESHSGPWNKSKRSDRVLPKPETFLEIVCHLCDYFASRSGVYIGLSKEN